jgi:hypothetical protein
MPFSMSSTFLTLFSSREASQVRRHHSSHAANSGLWADWTGTSVGLAVASQVISCRAYNRLLIEDMGKAVGEKTICSSSGHARSVHTLNGSPGAVPYNTAYHEALHFGMASHSGQ